MFDVLADEILEVNILAARKGLGAEGKQKVKDLFKELHSANPDLNKIHAEIEELKTSLGAKEETPSKREAEQKVLGSGARPTSNELSVIYALLDLNAKLPMNKRAEYRKELLDLKSKIGHVDDSEILDRIKEISMEIEDQEYSYSKPPRRNLRAF